LTPDRKTILDAKDLHNFLILDADTGTLFWKKRSCSRFNGNYAGKMAGTLNKEGYVCLRLLGKTLLAHRVIFAMHEGRWPSNQVDHINGIKTDNRPCNLRDVRISENLKNQKMRANNKSGITGVYWVPQKKKWAASISDSGKSVKLGLFKTIDEATMVRRQAEKRLGYSDGHGRRRHG
jgi:hypothetical protein